MATRVQPANIGTGAGTADAPVSAAIAALITNAPVPHPTLPKTFAAMMAREFRVLGRNAPSTFIRAVMQPLLFAFVFAYVLPKIGSGFSTGAGAGAGSSVNFSTILVPGLMGSMFLMQAFIGAAIVFTVVYWVHAPGQGPHIHVTNWFLLAVVMVAASALTASLGLWLGTVVDPRKMQMVFAVILLPLTMLGCVYYPWSALHVIRWLQIVVLVNPMVYMTEGLRAALTPGLGHMPLWAILVALIGGTAVFGALAVRTFHNRVVN
jgi:ABC-2 type transport system permease protein